LSAKSGRIEGGWFLDRGRNRYDVLHDQVTAHVCVVDVSLAYPLVFLTISPFWLAIGW